ncbi:uncharacterized protein LOC129320466 [Prosopis cineraria]|uniref:uncharacterized protein LOC129320466 n=1 Tax=Prosopis cineraria TaxID=364024 RepID=UPI00240FF4B3|nr:uncharacterized protein LOC129320466 [Prosopis cineraria]
MFGKIRPSSSLETLEGSPPSKILKDDSFSIYEATLMKLKLGAQRDTSAFSKESDEIMIDDSAISSSCVEGTNVVSTRISASASSSHHAPNLAGAGSMMTVSDCSSISTSPGRDQFSTGTSEQPRQSNISIIHFFSKVKDSRRIGGIDSSRGESVSTENDRPASASSSSEHNYRSETESIQSSPV